MAVMQAHPLLDNTKRQNSYLNQSALPRPGPVPLGQPGAEWIEAGLLVRHDMVLTPAAASGWSGKTILVVDAHGASTLAEIEDFVAIRRPCR
jgi:hypothetical protein